MAVTVKKLAQSNVPSGKSTFMASGTTSNDCIVQLTSTTALMVYNNQGASADARVITQNGDGSLSYGTNVPFSTANTTSYSAVVIDSTHVLITFYDAGNTNYGTALVATISGTTVSFGSKYVFSSVNYAGEMAVKLVSSTLAVITYTSTTSYIYAIACSISGSTLSYGSAINLGASTGGYYLNICSTDSTHVVVSYLKSGTWYATCCSISGTTLTAGSELSIQTYTSYGNRNVLETINSSTILFIGSSSNSLRGCVLSLSGTTLTTNTFAVAQTISNSGPCPQAVKLNSTQWFIKYNWQNAGNSNNYGTVVTVSGTSISFSAPVLFSTTFSYSEHLLGLCALNSTTFLYGYNESVYIINLNGTTPYVGGFPITLVTGVTSGHTEVSSIYLCNTGTTTSVVYILAHGTGGAPDNIIRRISMATNTEYVITLSNCPIILPAGETLRVYQDSNNQISCTVYGLEEV